MDEVNAGAVLLAAMTATAFEPGGGAPGDMDDDATLTLPSQRPMMFQEFEVEMQDRVGALETAVDDAVDHELLPEFAKMMRDIVFRTHLDVVRRASLGDPPVRVEPMTVRLQPGARAVRAKLHASPPAKAAWLHDTMVTPKGSFTPRRVPPGVLNTTGYFQATMGTSTRSVWCGWSTVPTA